MSYRRVAIDKLTRKVALGKTVDDIKSLIARALTSSTAAEDYASKGASVLAKFRILRGQCKHIFFTGEGIREWLMGCKCPPRVERMEEAMESYREDEAYLVYFNDNLPSVTIYRDSGQPRFLTAIIEENVLLIDLSFGAEDMSVDRGAEPLWNLVFAAAAYMHAFPETVSMGVPMELAETREFKSIKNARSVGIHEKIKVAGSQCFVRGHFMYLASERYTTKRFERVFRVGHIRGGGEAVTVD